MTNSNLWKLLCLDLTIDSIVFILGETGLRDVQAKLTTENRQYQKELDKIREEFEQYKRENNINELKDQVINLMTETQ